MDELEGAEMAAARRMGRQALHARSLAFDHPTSGARPGFTSSPPEDLHLLVEHLFGTEVAEELR